MKYMKCQIKANRVKVPVFAFRSGEHKTGSRNPVVPASVGLKWELLLPQKIPAIALSFRFAPLRASRNSLRDRKDS